MDGYFYALDSVFWNKCIEYLRCPSKPAPIRPNRTAGLNPGSAVTVAIHQYKNLSTSKNRVDSNRGGATERTKAVQMFRHAGTMVTIHVTLTPPTLDVLCMIR